MLGIPCTRICTFLRRCRVGLRVLLPGSFSNLRWFGRGPHENYPDRKASAAVGQYTSNVSEQATPYIRPGECGAKVDVRWLELSRPATPAAAAATKVGNGRGGEISTKGMIFLCFFFVCPCVFCCLVRSPVFHESACPGMCCWAFLPCACLSMFCIFRKPCRSHAREALTGRYMYLSCARTMLT